MNILVLLISLAFVAVGCLLAWKGHDPVASWGAIVFFGGCLIVAAWDLVQKNLRRPSTRTISLELHDNLQPLALRRSACHFLVYTLGSASFTFAGALLIWSGKAPILGGVTVVFFGLGAAVLLCQTIDPRPRLLFDQDGVLDRTLGVGRILWSDINGAYVLSVHGNDFVCLQVNDPSVYLAKLSPIRRKLVKANLALGFTELNLNLAGLKVDTEEVFRIILQRIQH